MMQRRNRLGYINSVKYLSVNESYKIGYISTKFEGLLGLVGLEKKEHVI